MLATLSCAANSEQDQQSAANFTNNFVVHGHPGPAHALDNGSHGLFRRAGQERFLSSHR